MINREMRKLRVQDKIIENAAKPLLNSPDVVSTGDFTFTKIMPRNRVGDSGSLLLAKRKGKRSEQYLVKHEYCDCACNEFVYTKLAQAMGYKMPDVLLFTIAPEEKRKYFKTEYIIGAKYLDIIKHDPSFSEIREEALNWEQYFSFWALYVITGEGDVCETPLASDGFIYRVDTTDAFPTCEHNLYQAGVNIKVDDITPKEFYKFYFMNMDIKKQWNVTSIDNWLKKFIEKYGNECIKPFLEPFERIQSISPTYIDEFLNTLCYFYPDFIGDFFVKYIREIKVLSREYLKSCQYNI